MRQIKAKRITFKQLVIRIRCRCAKWIWPNAGPISTFVAQERMEFETPKFGFPDDWEEPLSLNKGNEVSVEPVFVSADGAEFRCVIVPCRGRPIKLYASMRGEEVIMR